MKENQDLDVNGLQGIFACLSLNKTMISGAMLHTGSDGKCQSTLTSSGCTTRRSRASSFLLDLGKLWDARLDGAGLPSPSWNQVTFGMHDQEEQGFLLLAGSR